MMRLNLKKCIQLEPFLNFFKAIIHSKSRVYSQPWINITIDSTSIIQAFQDLRYLGELRQRWEEIKKLEIKHPAVTLAV